MNFRDLKLLEMTTSVTNGIQNMLEYEVLPVARDVSRTSLHQFTSQRTKLTKIEINSQWLPTVTI